MIVSVRVPSHLSNHMTRPSDSVSTYWFAPVKKQRKAPLDLHNLAKSSPIILQNAPIYNRKIISDGTNISEHSFRSAFFPLKPIEILLFNRPFFQFEQNDEPI